MALLKFVEEHLDLIPPFHPLEKYLQATWNAIVNGDMAKDLATRLWRLHGNVQRVKQFQLEASQTLTQVSHVKVNGDNFFLRFGGEFPVATVFTSAWEFDSDEWRPRIIKMADEKERWHTLAGDLPGALPRSSPAPALNFLLDRSHKPKSARKALHVPSRNNTSGDGLAGFTGYHRSSTSTQDSGRRESGKAPYLVEVRG
eukprot:gene33255-40232_t